MSFSDEVEKESKEAKRDVAKLVRAIYLQTLRAIVLGSPVKTGRFRANWQASTSTYPSGTVEKVDTGGGATISALSRIVSRIKDTYPDFYLANDLPYADPLERGHSKRQAPYGIVAPVVRMLTSRFKLKVTKP